MSMLSPYAIPSSNWPMISSSGTEQRSTTKRAKPSMYLRRDQLSPCTLTSECRHSGACKWRLTRRVRWRRAGTVVLVCEPYFQSKVVSRSLIPALEPCVEKKCT